MRFEDVNKRFAEHGFAVDPTGLPDGNQIRNTTSLKLTHSCGRVRVNGITLQKAVKHDFMVCPDCHKGGRERTQVWTHELLSNQVAKLGQTLLEPDTQTVFSRQSDAALSGARNTANVSCNACGHVRTVTVATLLKLKGNGCPQCKGMAPLTPDEVSRRAGEYGLLVLNKEDYTGGSTLLNFRCDACRHEFSQTWQNQRNRSCAKCTRVFGEILIEALGRHYFPDNQWQSQYAVKGLVPGAPDTTLFYDVASPDLRLVIENHSGYHDAESFSFNGASIDDTLEQRRHYDALKKSAVEPGGALEGWKYAEFRFELATLKDRVDKTGSYLPAVCKEYRDKLIGLGYTSLRDQPDAVIDDLFANLNPLRLLAHEAAPYGYSVPVQSWSGRDSAYDLTHQCGRTVKERPFVLKQDWAAGLTGCGWCDSSGREGLWRQFVQNMRARGWPVVDSELVPIGEQGPVRFSCTAHPEEGELFALRARLRSELLPDSPLWPTCPGCRKAMAERAKATRTGEGQKTLQEFDRLLRAHGMRLLDWEWKGTSIAKPGKKMTFAKYRVACDHCPSVREVLVHQTRAKLSKRKSTGGGCPACARKRPLGFKRRSPSRDVE